MSGSSRGPGDAWRWHVDRHYRPSYPAYSISVSEPTDEQMAEREAKLEAGAEVVPFGFSRALPRRVAEPLLWEGDDG